MAFISYNFLIFFLPVVFLLYCICKKSVTLQNTVMLVASIIFYACFDYKYIFFLFISIAVTYLGGLIGESQNTHRKATFVYVSALVLNLLLLVVFKYTGFVLGNINTVLSQVGITFTVPKILLPVGLSFFVFQSSSYLLDLRNGKTTVEKNIVNYALFVSFFPTITSGPIQRSYRLLPQIRKKRDISFARVQEAVLVFLWGAFVKMVLADRLAVFTNEVFANYNNYSGAVLVMGVLAYTIQIYADFSGYSHMAIAVAHLFGFDMPENFRQPYFALNIADFWRRWHISLTSWFTEYLYFSLGGNRKGELRRYINIFIVFLVSGLWHGASWTFVIWGALHAAYQIVGRLTKNARNHLCSRMHINRDCASFRLLQRVFIFCIVAFAWIFFRVDGMENVIGFISRMITQFNVWTLFDGSLFNIGLTPVEWNIVIAAVAVLFTVSLYRERGISVVNICRSNIAVRIVLVCILTVVLFVFGMYGEQYSASSFIYAGF